MSTCLFYNTTDQCFINQDLSEKHSLRLDLSLITLFVIVTVFEPIIFVCFLQAKQ